MGVTAKKAEWVLFDLVRDIAAGSLGPGDRLPALREMMRRYETGATPLREALRLLEIAGLVSVRPGATLGTVVEEAKSERLAALAAAFFSVSGVTYGQLLSAWVATEPMLAAAAASHCDREMVAAELAPFLNEPHSEHELTPAEAIDFHDAIARATGNPALALILQVVCYVVADLYWASTQLPPAGGQVRHEHGAIARAIVAGDAEQARQLMEDHARAMSESVILKVGRSADDRIVWPRKAAGTAPYRARGLGAGADHQRAGTSE